MKKRNIIKQNGVAWVFVLPYLSIFFVFTILPVIISMFFSFTDFNMLETPNFIGMGNYTRLFLQDDIFIKSIGNTFILAMVTGPLG